MPRVWPKAEEFGFANEMECFGLQFGHSVGLFLHERPIISRLNSLEHPVEIKEGMVIALETYCPAKDGYSAARIEEEVVVTAEGPAGDHRFPSAELFVANAVLSRGRHAGRRRPTSTETGLRMYRTMVECRSFEVRAQELFFEGLVRGTTHLGIGPGGRRGRVRGRDARGRLHVRHVSRPQPRPRPRHADGPALRGAVRPGERADGRQGRLDAHHRREHHMMGSYAIVGAHLPIALGAAWSAQYRKSGQVAVCFFGDGTTNIGAFHEALNMAVVWKAPVVFVCENNQYMEYTPIGAVTAVARPAADRAAAYGLESIVIDGNDAEEVYGTAHAGHRTGTERRRAVARRGPDVPPRRALPRGPGKYRPDDEVAAWLAKDPIPRSEQARSSSACRRPTSTRSTRRSRRSWRRARPRREAPSRSRRRRCSRPRSGPTGARHGGATYRG